MAFSAALLLLAAEPASLAAFEAKLAAHDSATQALGEWCAARGIADPAVIRAEDRRQTYSNSSSAKMRRLLAIRSGDHFVIRYVHLVCGTKVLSVAWNWYVPSRLTLAMNQTLESSNTPFGKVAAPLKFRRQALETVTGTAENCPSDTISTHRARLILPDGKPLAYLVECYTAANLQP